MTETQKENMEEQLRIPEPKKKRFGFLRKKSFWIIAAIVLIVGGWLLRAKLSNKGPFYETADVTRGDVQRTVEVTGEVVPEARLSLAFKNTGNLETLNVRLGDHVKAGTVLAELESRDLRFNAERARASLAIASANLNAKLAGASDEAIAIKKASVEQARAAHEKAQIDLDVTRQSAENSYQQALLAYDLAKENLDNSGATAEQAVVTSFESLRAALQTSLGAMRTGLVDGDAIIGVDNVSANDDYEGVLGIFDRASLDEAKSLYPSTRDKVNAADTKIRALSTASSQSDILDSALLARDALESVQLYLTYVQKTLAGTITNVTLTQTELDTKKTKIATDITSVGTQLSSVVSDYESAKNADLTRQTTVAQLQNAYDAAKLKLDIADSDRTSQVKTAEANVDIQAAALASAQAALDEAVAPPRNVDLAGLRAQVLDAQTAYNQAVEKLADVRIVAPLDGVVTEIVPELGELVTAGNTAIRMVAADHLTIEALVPEADITKVEPGQSITITLDAYGDDVQFTGNVVSENADQTVVQDAIYYTTYVDFDQRDLDVKSGMTANLTILTGERKNVLFIPSRSLRISDGSVSVRVLSNGAPEDREIEIGLRGDEGRVEVLSGLEEGEKIITGELTAEEYARTQ